MLTVCITELLSSTLGSLRRIFILGNLLYNENIFSLEERGGEVRDLIKEGIFRVKTDDNAQGCVP